MNPTGTGERAGPRFMHRRWFSLVTLVALLAAAKAPPPLPLTPFELRAPVGAPLPPMILRTLEGATIDTAGFRGKPTFIVLLASWCEPCTKTLPNLRADQARYGDRVRFVGVDVYEDRARAAAFLAKEKLPFPVAVYTLAELDAAVSPARREREGTHFNIPGDVLVGADGIVRAAWYGVFDAPDGSARDDLPAELAKLGIE